jgi:tRNA pseudouridine38-40 synthase
MALALTVSYDGSGFAGSQRVPGARTVQEVLETALADMTGEPETTIFAGRTDRGVHAAGQVVSWRDARPDLEVETVRAALNARLPPDLAIVALERVDDRFHARYDARWREYRYRVWSGPVQPLARDRVWQRSQPLDRAAMDRAARMLVGERDFATFAGAGEGVPWSERWQRRRGTTRTVLVCRCAELEPWWGPATGRLVEFQVAADGFLPHMVRNLVGALIRIGRGDHGPEWVMDLLARRDRRMAPATAPACGLTLWRVGYGDDRPDLASTRIDPTNQRRGAPDER